MPLPWWIVVPVLAALAAIAVGARRGRRVEPLPVADAAALRGAARRTAAVRGGFLLAIGGALAAAFVTSPRPTGQLSSLVASGQSTVVVLDMSQSVSDLVYREIARTLEGIVTSAGDQGRLGLVMFSDHAQEALPPDSNAAELVPFVRYFRPLRERGLAGKPVYYRAAGPTEQAATQYPLNPWFGRFSGGTQISTGLRAAREALQRDGQGGRAVLLSDLGEAEEDVARLTRELVRWVESPELELRVVALPPATPARKAAFERITGDRGLVVDSLALATGNDDAGEPAGSVPWPFVGVVVALALALAANEARGVPLAWRPVRGAGR
jgi:hypothetical protein